MWISGLTGVRFVENGHLISNQWLPYLAVVPSDFLWSVEKNKKKVPITPGPGGSCSLQPSSTLLSSGCKLSFHWNHQTVLVFLVETEGTPRVSYSEDRLKTAFSELNAGHITPCIQCVTCDPDEIVCFWKTGSLPSSGISYMDPNTQLKAFFF